MYKTWIKTFFGVFLIGLMFIISLNAIVDPMMVLPFVHRFNNRVRFLNERQQKTNLLYFSEYYKKYDPDSIILGSSRSSGLTPDLFAPQYTIFNYAAAAIRPPEMNAYIHFAQELHGRPLRLIVLGLDFMGADGQPSKSHTKGLPVAYTQEVKKPFYALATLMNLKSFHLATRNLRANLHPSKSSYFERRTLGMVEYFRPGEDIRQKDFEKTMQTFQEVYGHFHYNPDYKQMLLEIKQNYPQTQFIVFTTPVSKPHLDLLFEKGLADSYRQWLTDIVEVFGSVTHFMDENEITRNYMQHFADSHHLYLDTSALLVRRLLDQQNSPAGFGKILTQENLPQYLKTIPSR